MIEFASESPLETNSVSLGYSLRIRISNYFPNVADAVGLRPRLWKTSLILIAANLHCTGELSEVL